MDHVIVALTKLIEHSGARKFEVPATIAVELGGAPKSVVKLAKAMATHYFNLSLGEFKLYAGSARTVHTLRDSIEMSDISLDEIDEVGEPLDPDATLHIAADGGGMSTLGIGWTPDGQISLIVVEIDDPVPENLIRRFTTPAAFLGFLERKGADVGADVRALLAGS